MSYKRYVEADAAWSAAVQDAMGWFPGRSKTNLAIVGNPGSPVRSLYAKRERAVLQMAVALEKFKTAKMRLNARRTGERAKVLLIGFVQP